MGHSTMKAALTETKAVLRKADAAWAKHACPGTAECCQLKTTGRPPYLWPTEWKLLEAKGPVPPPRADGGCPYLDAAGKRCTVYADRPLGCRTFFCHRITGPKKQPGAETDALFERLKALNLALDDEAKPRSLPEWVAGSRAQHPSTG